MAPSGSVAARREVGQNPSTGETVAIPARRVPVFTPSRILCNRVDQGNI
ncbi:MAG: hypothetical protein F4058_01055 [Rhodothermaceae bacterium]|nr:hypothetical protein [Rhodothermaceae bacterium]MYF63893.1 hypothetical protein [Rhodothermaceae bacterium]MYI83899.1 hypothetical protein [Rhodothermaceae bacterium]